MTTAEIIESQNRVRSIRAGLRARIARLTVSQTLAMQAVVGAANGRESQIAEEDFDAVEGLLDLLEGKSQELVNAGIKA